MNDIHILLFYQYIKIDEPEVFAKQHALFCKKLELQGRILVAQEGINGSVSGTKEQTEQYKRIMHQDSRFTTMPFKEDIGMMHPFKKMIVKVKQEIVTFGQNVDLKKSGKHLSPQEFVELYEKGEEVVILDARNEYESRVGKFKGAITTNIQTFREFPQVIEQIKDKKEKKIVMYCTGGIRCEKASAYLVENGFKEVYQLDGGILNFGKHFPDTIWEGKCFVFDKRLLQSINSKEKPLTNCELCTKECDLYKNCAHIACDRYCAVCLKCEQKYGGCCSKECFAAFMQERQSDQPVKNEEVAFVPIPN